AKSGVPTHVEKEHRDILLTFLEHERLGIGLNKPLDRLWHELGQMLPHELKRIHLALDSLLQTQRGPNACQQFVTAYWLGQEVVGPGFNALDAVLYMPQRRHDDDRYEPRVGIIFENFAGFEAIHDRHHDVQEDEVRPFLLHLQQRFLAIGGFHNLIASRQQQGFQQLDLLHLVNHDEDLRLWCDHWKYPLGHRE